MTKRILSILVAALMVMAVFPMSVFAKAASPADKGEAPKAVLDEPVYSCSFEANDGYEYWSLYDADGDGSSWELVSSYVYDGNSALVSYSYKNGTALDPDNWLITPEIHIPENEPSASFYAANAFSSYPDTIAVYAVSHGEDGQFDYENAVELVEPFQPGTVYERIDIDLTAYAGQSINIAIRHFDSYDMMKIYVDLFQVWGEYDEVDPTEPPLDPTPAPTYTPAEEVEMIEITGFTVPAWGEHPDYIVEVPEDAGYTLELTEWYYYGKGAVSPEDVFDDPDVGYYQFFSIKLKEGYEWANSVGAKINGQYSLVNYVLNEYDPTLKSVYSIQFNVQEPAEPTGDPYLITQINVNGFVAPVPDMTGSEYMALFVDDNEPYGIISIEAFDYDTGDQLAEDDVLEEGHRYIVGALVETDLDYSISPDAVLTANNGAFELAEESGIESSYTAWVVVGPLVCEVSDLDRALNAPGGTLHFETYEDYPWFTVMDDESGRFYAQSGNGGVNSSSSVLWTMFDSVEGDVLVFDYKAWGEGSNWDTCELTVDEHWIFSYGAVDNDWTTYVFPLEPGNHLVGWVYNKDYSVHPVGDYFAVDDVYVGPPIFPEEIEAEDITVFVNHSRKIEWTVLPEDATFNNVKFEVADESIATVDKNGLVHGLEIGDTEVTISIDYFPEEEPEDPSPDPTLSSTNDEVDPDYPEISTTITVHVVPIQDFVVGYYFETQPEEEGWQFVDADGDTYTWHWNWDDEYYDAEALAEAAYEGEGFIMSDSVLEPYTTESTYGYEKGVVEPEYHQLEPDNWAISPAVTLPNETAWMTFFASSFFYEDFYENYELYIGLTDDIEEMELLQEVTRVSAVSYYDYYTDEMSFNYEEFYVDLTEYAGQTVYVAFRHLLNLQNEDDYSNIFLAIDAVEFFGTDEELTVIDTIDIRDLEIPEWGASPDYEVTVPENAGYTVEVVEWTEYSMKDVMQPGDVFDNADEFYFVNIKVDVEEGYTFADELTYLLNGGTELIRYSGHNTYLDTGVEYAWIISIDFTVEEPVTPTEPPVEPSLIYAVDISELDIPVWGANPDYDVVLPDDAHYFLTDFIWDYYNGTEDVFMDPADVFDDADGEYYTIFVVDPEEGWEFAPDDEMTVTINGTESLVDFFFVWDGELCIASVDFTVEAPPALIYNVDVSELEIPEWGANPDYDVVLPADAQYLLTEFDWDYYNGTEDVVMAPEDVYDDADGEYYTIFVVVPEEGCEFAPDDEMTVTINGVEELVDFFFTWDGELYIVSIDFTVEEPPAELIPIHEVIVNGWGRPVPFVAGIDHVFLETPADAPYFIVYGGWRDETDQQQMWNEDHVFMPEHWYSEGCQIWADEGYYFAEDCVFRTEDDRVHLDYEYCYVDELDDWICYMNIEPILCILWGDAEHDNDVDSPDVLLLMRYCMDLVPAEDVYLDVCDVNADGDYTMADALLIMRKVLHLIDYFPVELIY